MYRGKGVGFVHHHKKFEQPLIEVLTARSLNQSFLEMGYTGTADLWKTAEENVPITGGQLALWAAPCEMRE